MPSGLPPEALPVARTSTTGPAEIAAAWAPPGAGPLEMAVAGVVVLSLVPFLWLMGRAMATTSLGNDELYTILQFSSRGPWVSWTDYHVPNNHVLFNLLNAVTPDTASLDPLRARLWSFVFTGVAILYVLGRSFSTRRYLGGAAIVSLIWSNPAYLEEVLLARGHGILSLCAVVNALVLFDALPVPRLSALAVSTLAVVVGTAAVPVYLLFGGPLLLLLFLFRPSRRAFLSGALAVLVVALFYAPTFRQVLWAAVTYGDIWGRDYATLEAVGHTVRTYLLDRLPVGAVAVVLGLTAIGAFVGPAASARERAASQVLCLSIAGFFALCRLLETPPIDTTSFIVGPVAVLLVSVALGPYLKLGFRPRRVVCLVLGALLVANNASRLQRFDFLPAQSWMETAEALDLIAPQAGQVFAPFRSQYLRVYLSGRLTFADHLQLEEFRLGRLVIVDSDFTPHRRLAANELSVDAVELRVPQRWGRFQQVLLVPPRPSHVPALTVREPQSLGPSDRADRSPRALGIEMTLEPARTYRSVVLHARHDGLPHVRAVTLRQGGERWPLSQRHVLRLGNALILDLGGRRLDGVSVTLAPFGAEPFPFDRIWGVPVD